MKAKIIIRLILVAVIACAAYFCYPSVHQFFLKYQHPLDDIYEYDGQEITIRNLFVASNENILYASHLNVSGRRENYLSSASYSTNNTRTINLGDSESISYTDLEYERSYIDSDNYAWTVSGTGRDSEFEYYNFMGALIKFTISQSEAEIGCIVMPLVVSGDGIINENNLLISAGDTMSVDNKCCIKVYHTVSDSLSSVTCYSFQLESFDFAYSILKEAKISNLLNDEELSLFAGEDSENLRTFASDYKQAEYSSIDKYVIKEGDNQCGYYVIEDEIHPDEYGTIYELSIVSLDTVEKETSKYGNESEVSWQSFDE